MNHPSPAIVTQAAARPFPRLVLLLLCLAYGLSGFLGRAAWKSADMTALGYMAELARGSTSWTNPLLMGIPPESPALLPYWLGAWAIQAATPALAADFAARLPFGALLALTMLATWYATYNLARSAKAQPVAFAFGGEALPTDYARAMADAGLLALLACLGLAQLSHETTPALAQLGFSALFFYAIAALPYRNYRNSRNIPAMLALACGLTGLTLSGAPSLALLFGLGSAGIHYLDQPPDTTTTTTKRLITLEIAAIVVLSLANGALALGLDLWRWKIELPHATWAEWNGYAQLLLWFTWPAWPLAVWTVWRWRHQLFSRQISRHLALPAWLVLVCTVATLLTGSPDRTLLLSLPPLATLAAFALPTLKRQVSALIDWFTLLFFSGCGFIIWVVWIATQTGFPAQPAANVKRLAPGFESSFSLLSLAVAICATLVWAWLVRWRVGRHRAAIWKSLVLPGGGAALCWLLVMTLWLQPLDHAQSYTSMVTRTIRHINTPGCVETLGLDQGQIAAFQFYGGLQLMAMQTMPVCPWLLAEPGPGQSVPETITNSPWVLQTSIRHSVADNELLLLFHQRIEQ